MTTSPTAQFLAEAITASGKTQREIAERTGFENPNIISMMKAGETKVPVERIPALAVACKADPKEFLRVAMREYHPEMWEVLYIIFDPPFSKQEIELIDLFRSAVTVSEVEWKLPDQKILIAMFKYIHHWMRAYEKPGAQFGKVGKAPRSKD